jgi:hypothetical protein
MQVVGVVRKSKPKIAELLLVNKAQAQQPGRVPTDLLSILPNLVRRADLISTTGYGQTGTGIIAIALEHLCGYASQFHLVGEPDMTNQLVR